MQAVFWKEKFQSEREVEPTLFGVSVVLESGVNSKNGQRVTEGGVFLQASEEERRFDKVGKGELSVRASKSNLMRLPLV